MANRPYKFLTAAEERQLFVRYRKHGDQEALTALINSQTALAKGLIAKKVKGLPLHERDDAMSEAPLCVWDAVQRMDLSRGIRLGTLVSWQVRNRMNRRYAGGVIHIPEHVKDLIAPPEIHSLHSLNGRLIDWLNPADPHDDIAELAEADVRAAKVRQLEAALTLFSDRQREVLYRRMFMDETLEQVGRAVQVTRERVRQIELQVLYKLRLAVRRDLSEIVVPEELRLANLSYPPTPPYIRKNCQRLPVKPRPKPLSEKTVKIAKLLRRRGALTRSQIVKATRLHPHGVSITLSRNQMFKRSWDDRWSLKKAA